MFIFKESTSRVDHDAKCLNRDRSHRANVLLFHDVLSMSRLFLKKAIEILEEGITKEIFARETKEIDYFLQLELKLYYSE